MRTFGMPEFWFILEAAKWTLALSAIAVCRPRISC